MNNYCVYFYLREDLSPYYVGMGRKERPYAKHAHRHEKGDFKPKSNDFIKIIHENLSQKEAFDFEIFYIKAYGRKCDGGILINLTEGGEGAKHNEETKKKLSLIKTGTKASEETRKKMSEKRKGKKMPPGTAQKALQTRILNNNLNHSEETKRKLSASLKGLQVGSKNPAARKILVYDLENNYVGEFETAREAAIYLNIGDCWKHIPAVCRGKRKHTCGFIFKYFDDVNLGV